MRVNKDSKRGFSLVGCVVVLSCMWMAATARAKAPVGRFVVDTVNDTVGDTRTGLTWRRTPSQDTMIWEAAKTYCVSPWRLPTIRELESIVDYRVSSPAIDVQAFPNTPSAAFWSSSPCAYFNYAWMVYFGHGESDPIDVGSYNRVRCVR